MWHGVVYERNPLWPSGDMPNLSVDFTSQCLKDSAKPFDNHAVVFISGLYRTSCQNIWHYHSSIDW